jgi:TIR domain
MLTAMDVFICHAHEDKVAAEQIHLALAGADHTTFFDRESLGAGGEYHSRIQDAIERCDAFVFLVSRASVAKGSYTLTELKQARARWAHPTGRVLPVMVDAQCPVEAAPAYLREVTVLEPEGHMAAEVLFAIERLPALRSPEGAASPETRRTTGNQAPQVQLLGTRILHNQMVPSAQGPAPGLQVLVSAEVAHAAGRMFQLFARFGYAGGAYLMANPQEPWFRDPAGVVCTGTQPLRVSSDRESLPEQVMSLPYFALNFAPMNGMGSYLLACQAVALIDQQVLAQALPLSFPFRW